jgi:asparagine synthase (glutamine-hydrolysing)
MSVQFGRWNTDGQPVDRDYFEKVSPLLAPYGPDGAGSYSKGNISILYRAFHTTKESRCEVQPQVTESGTVFTWDGRLDNRAELISQLRNVLKVSSTDVSVAVAAYEKWGTDCFAKLIGDWALSIWDTKSRSLILAKDPIGIRHLYYSMEKGRVTWSTILDPLVLLAGHSFALNEEYIAGWFSFFPAAHLTPYVGIHSVPPSSSVVIRDGKRTVTRYWDFDSGKQIRYRSDAEYEEHFRIVFAKAVQRRLRSDRPILAELSGGMDSSSIVCMADTAFARGIAEAPRLDTVSYYDDSEPNWDERPYFSKVEEKRGRAGTHIDVGNQGSLMNQFESDRFAATPGSSGRGSSEALRQFAACMTSQGNRVVLSGIGGDEFTGGVATPIPELANLIAGAQFRTLARQLKLWALCQRKPWIHLFFEAARGFFPPGLLGVMLTERSISWLDPNFVKRNRAALLGYETRMKLFGPVPSFQRNLSTLDSLRRQLMCQAPPSEPHYEKRYPYLDRGLLEFIYTIPRAQLVRPSQRRSLMRRALVGIVPNEILHRKRKAYIVRSSMKAISAEYRNLVELSHHLESGSLGIVDPTGFQEILLKVRKNQEVPMIPLLRTIGIEIWLQNLRDQGWLNGTPSARNHDYARNSRRRNPAVQAENSVEPKALQG